MQQAMVLQGILKRVIQVTIGVYSTGRTNLDTFFELCDNCQAVLPACCFVSAT
jgi:hypothetical protein